MLWLYLTWTKNVACLKLDWLGLLDKNEPCGIILIPDHNSRRANGHVQQKNNRDDIGLFLVLIEKSLQTPLSAKLTALNNTWDVCTYVVHRKLWGNRIQSKQTTTKNTTCFMAKLWTEKIGYRIIQGPFNNIDRYFIWNFQVFYVCSIFFVVFFFF